MARHAAEDREVTMRRLEPGVEIDGFRLLERLGKGGMASVWRATHPDHALPLVLKIPFLDPGEDVSVIIGYETEEMVLKRLSGPHVPRFIASGDLARTPYIAMEFVEGEHVAAKLAATPLQYEAVATIGVGIARALVSIHGQKVAHLDLKPENVILNPRGAVLIDFGLARHAELPDLLTEDMNVVKGSPAYMAPEQVLGIRSDPVSDIFALGAILYQLATGVEPFGRPTTTAGLRRRLYHAPPEPRSLNPKIPRWLEAVIVKAMEVDRGRRYADAGKLLFDLTHPDQVPVAPQMRRKRGWFDRLFRRSDDRALIGRSSTARAALGPSIVLAAVDLTASAEPLAAALLAETARLVSARPDSRLACLSVLKSEGLALPEVADEAGRSLFVERLVALKHWARSLDLPEQRVSFHVIEASDPADAILAFCEHNEVGHIVVGARGSSALRRHLGSVSAKVVAEAPCSVSVVRVKRAVDADDAGADGSSG
jgi:serine/threonine protein kinase